VARQAFEQWPVRTGLSKSLLALEATVSPDGGELDVRLVNRAPYAAMISRGQVVEQLVFAPGAAAAEAMVDDIAKEITR
jgi:dUTPase